MGIPVVIVDSGGLAVRESDNGFGTPMDEATNGFGIPVTFVDVGGQPVVGISNGASIRLSANTIAENSADGTAVGTLSISNGSGTYDFTLTDSASSKFKVAGTHGVNLQAGSSATDYEAATFHSITIQADNGVDPPTTRTLTIFVTNVVEDTTPTAFSFTDVTSAALSTVYESNAITVAGMDGPANVTITGGEYSKNGGSYSSAATTAIVGDTFKVRATSSGSNSTAVNVALAIGGVSDTFSVTTLAGAGVGPTIDLLSSSDTGSSSTDDITSDTTPTLNIDYTLATVTAGDATEVEDNGVQISTFTTTSDMLAGGDIDLDLSALSAGSHAIRTRINRVVGGPTPYGNTVTVVVEAAFTLSSASGAQLAQSTASLSVSTNGATGTLYYVVTTSATPPSAAQVKAGQNDGGTSALYAGSQSISSTGTKTATATGVTVGTRYAYYMHEGAAGVQSIVASSSSWSQADITAPVLSNATDTKTGSTTGTITVDTDEGNGTLYWILSSAITAPTAAQIVAGNDHTGSAALKSGNASVSGTGTQTINATSLTASTTYYAHFAQKDAANNSSNVASGNGMTTDAAPSSTTWDASKKHATITLSGGNLTATSGGGGSFPAVLAVSGQSSGKRYFECAVTTGVTAFCGIGIGTASANTDSYPGGDTQSAGVIGDGSFNLNNSFSPSISAWASGDVVSIAVDLDANLFWARTNGGNWNNSGAANPATGAGGISIAGLAAGTKYPMANLRSNGDTAVGNFNTGTATQSVPSGFSNW